MVASARAYVSALNKMIGWMRATQKVNGRAVEWVIGWMNGPADHAQATATQK